ncbi:MAG TPA: HD domain-containing protein [Methylomusa anaerophila]|uniref:Cyclic di-GMP phosphodiesterase response regulator RpfG n=1 Tax=Methylomusa anaerophila TaxID=1930071 RepID=A0A348AG33_9FIRM|nr:HD domain-containing phosphohydrolase [Methylomusa anaerophila]BBB90031.1 cyclic di-GMP phosphodiesterase response regulator RpfG [Methylomusa anaerophila]HML88241.1 HD domain-containing protein [Methylomusa anaerophila]
MLKSIRTELFIVTVLMVIIPLITCSIFNYYIISRDVGTKMREDSLVFTLSVARNIRSLIDKSYAVAEELSANTDISSFNPANQEMILRQAASRHPQFDLLFVQDIHGWQTANSLGVPGSDRSGRWWYKKFMSLQTPFVSKSYYTTTDNTAVTSIFMPVYSLDGLIGILGADLKLDSIQDLVEQLTIGKGSYTYILDGQGTVVAHPDKNQVAELYNYQTLTRTIQQKDANGIPLRDRYNNHITQEYPISVPEKLHEVVSLALQGESGTAEYQDLSGNDMICAYTAVYLPGNSENWAVITVDNKTTAMATATQIIDKNTWGTAIALIGTILIVYLLSRRITHPILLMDEQIKRITRGQLHKPLAGDFGKNEVGRLAHSFEDMRATLAKVQTEQENMFLSTIRALVMALESKDGYTHSHSVEVAEIATKVAAELGLSQQEQFKIKFAALLHDIGKIGIPDHILNKNGSLSDEEWDTMRQHPTIGAKIISTIPNMEEIAHIIKHHHSRWDGKGYPGGILGENIPLGARIIAVADAFQAMTSDRPYRQALSYQYAIAEIRRCAGNQFDAQIIDAFLKVADQ